MDDFITLNQIDQITQSIRSRISVSPATALILGSGLGEIADSVSEAVYIPYGDYPLWPVSTVQGHLGRLVAGYLQGKPVLLMQGRAHYYEGYTMQQIGLPVRVMHRLGIKSLIVTNAAGSVNPDYSPGDLMLINDHLNLIGMAGLTPLRGPNLDELGPRFPDMSQAYDRSYAELARSTARELKIQLREGVYVCLAGPSFESPADLRFLRTIGADAVGMSTVPEVTVARHAGMRVLGISGISNKANLDGNTATSHEEVLAAGQILVPKFVALIRGILNKM